jgi:hypothetical protein
MKKCCKCKEEKILSEFYKSKATHDGFHPQCKDCKKASDRCSYLKHKEKKTTHQRDWYKKNAEDQREKAKKRYKKRMQNPDEKRKILDLKNKRQRDMCSSDPSFRIRKNFSRAVGRGLEKGWRSWEKWVNYTLEDLVSHLEKQFNKKMTMENYGTYWHIDHIVPASSFMVKVIGDEEFMACWSLSNLRPLEAAKNLEKHNKRTHLL